MASALRSALATLYHSGDAATRRGADEYVQAFLRSADAWPVSLELLRVGEAPEQLFAARALHGLLRCSVSKAAKTQASHLVLDDGDWQASATSLSLLARRWAAQPAAAAILTQLSLALSSLYVKWLALPPQQVLPVALGAFGGDVACSLMLLRLLPEEVNARELSCHPARRAEVACALRQAAPQVLDALAGAAAAAAAEDTATQELVLHAFASWCDFGVEPHAMAASPLTAAAFAVVACGTAPDALASVALSAACAATSALLRATGRAHAERLPALLRTLRGVAAHAPCHSPQAGAACALLSHAAVEALADEAHTPVVLEALDGLLDAMEFAPGTPEAPLTWLTPWSMAADAGQPPSSARALAMRPAAQRLASLAGARAAQHSGEEGLRESLADGLRDVTAVVGAQALLPALAHALRRALDDGDGARAEGCAFAAAAVARGIPAGSSVEAEQLCAAALQLLNAPDASLQTAHSAVALLGALGTWLGSAPPDASSASAAGFLAALRCPDATLARAAAVALMRACDAGAAHALAAHAPTQVSALAQLLAAGGPAAPHPHALRAGQEPVGTILLRALVKVALLGCGDAALLGDLARSPAHALRSALAAVHAQPQDEFACASLCRALRDARVVLEESTRCSDSHASASLVAAFWPLLAAAAEIRAPGACRDALALELSNALWTMLAPPRPIDTLSQHALMLALNAFTASRAPAFLELLQRCVEQRTDCTDAAAAACCRALSAEPSSVAFGAPLLRLLAACVRARAAALAEPAVLAALLLASARACAHCSGDDARAACALAAALLASPFRCDAGASAFTDAARAALLCPPGGGAPLVHALLAAANGALPPDCVSLVADALHAAWCAAGDATFLGWLHVALADANFPRPGTSPKLKATFCEALLERDNRADPRRFKRLLKSFCGGKKKQTETTNE